MEMMSGSLIKDVEPEFALQAHWQGIYPHVHSTHLHTHNVHLIDEAKFVKIESTIIVSMVTVS